MAVEVEEDPSSQFVDFTNATAMEQFASDLEQALLAWQLANKGHASLEALAAAFPLESDAGRPRVPGDGVDAEGAGAFGRPVVWTRVVEFAQTPSVFYTLSLFVGSSHAAAQEQASGKQDSERGNVRGKTWQEGIEHFTPTMLSLSDAARDFRWNGASVEQGAGAGSRNGDDAMASSMFDGADDAVVQRSVVFENVQKWLGVDEFLFLSRSTQHDQEKSLSARPKTRGVSVDSTDSMDALSVAIQSSRLGEHGGADPSGTDSTSFLGVDGIADVSMDQNESGLLLSALMIALNNCNCTIPAFVPVFEPSRGTWIGSAVPGETGNVSIAFETDSVPELNPNQSCISGLLDFFKLKLQLPPQVEEKCRLAAEDTGEIAMGMAVSASFGYAWVRSEDPREDAGVDKTKNPVDWSEFMNHTAQSRPTHVQQVSSNVFGARMNPSLGPGSSSLTGMDLKVSWPNLREGTYVDNVVHSTLDPQTAPDWTLKVRFRNLVTENARKPSLPLSKMVANLVQAYSNSKELSKDILVSELAPNINDYPPQSTVASSPTPTPTPPPSVGKESSLEGQSFPSNSRLQDSIPASRAAAVIGSAIGSIISAATWKTADVEEIRRVIAELFDQDDSARTANEYVSSPSAVQHGAPVGQLVSILACRMGQLHGINSMALLWVEFVKGLRERWFQQKLLPFMSTAVDNGSSSHSGSSTSLSALFLLDSDAFRLPQPDFHQCLLHQKLQLLNCCILREAEVARSERPSHASPPPRSTMFELTAFTLDDGDGDEEMVNEVEVEDVEEASPSDDEFFDTVEQHESPRLTSQPAASTTSEGGLRTIPDVVCLRTNAPMVEPATQIAVPMTEDVAKQQQDLLTRLGVSLESAMLRQQIQSTVLISDMQAFKAANPGSCLVDFIRWYSPKDWIAFDSLQGDQLEASLPEEGRGVWWFEKQGMLSDRMRFDPSNEHIWQHMWETSPPVPASRQKRLFDPVQESEKLFHYLETMSPHEMLHQALSGAISGACFALETALLPIPIEKLPVVQGAVEELRVCGNRAIAMLDEALAESEMAFPAGQKDEQERARSQMQVAFEMALDACWKLVHGVECVQALISNALAVTQYFPREDESSEAQRLELINLLLMQSLPAGLRKEEHASTAPQEIGRRISLLLQTESIRRRVASIVLENPALSGPVEREYVLRCVCPRPFLRDYYEDYEALEADESDSDAASAFDAVSVISGSAGDGRYSSAATGMGLEESPLVVNRMYAAFRKNTVRFALALAEAEF